MKRQNCYKETPTAEKVDTSTENTNRPTDEMAMVVKAGKFVDMNADNTTLYQLVDASDTYCKNEKRRKVVREVYRWQVKEEYEDVRVMGFELIGKKTMILYCDFSDS